MDNSGPVVIEREVGHHVSVAPDLTEPDDTLQAQGDAVLAQLAAGEAVRAEAEQLVERLRARGWEGDDVLADELAAVLKGEEPAGRPLPVRLDDLANELGGDPLQESGALDLITGEVVPGALTDPMWDTDDEAYDFESEPDRWLHLPPRESGPGWGDMALFAERTEPPLRDRLEVALHGKGAFRRFKDELFRADLLGDFYTFANDRELGRARQFLADEGIRAVPS